MSGFIKVHREILDWEWYKDTNAKVLFLHCILKANWESKNWRGIDINRGQFITSVDTLSFELKLSSKQVRIAIEKLRRANEIAIKATNKFTIVTLVKYDAYQNIDNEKGKQNGNLKGIKAESKKAITKEDKEVNNILLEKESKATLFPESEVAPEPKKDIKIDWQRLLIQFNSITKKNSRVVNEKTKRQVLARLKEGYSRTDIITAIENCYKDQWHIDDGHNHLTLEFISRPDKLEKYLTAKPKLNGIKEQQQPTVKTPYKFSMQRIIDQHKQAATSDSTGELFEDTEYTDITGN